MFGFTQHSMRQCLCELLFRYNTQQERMTQNCSFHSNFFIQYFVFSSVFSLFKVFFPLFKCVLTFFLSFFRLSRNNFFFFSFRKAKEREIIFSSLFFFHSLLSYSLSSLSHSLTFLLSLDFNQYYPLLFHFFIL